MGQVESGCRLNQESVELPAQQVAVGQLEGKGKRLIKISRKGLQLRTDKESLWAGEQSSRNAHCCEKIGQQRGSNVYNDECQVHAATECQVCPAAEVHSARSLCWYSEEMALYLGHFSTTVLLWGGSGSHDQQVRQKWDSHQRGCQLYYELLAAGVTYEAQHQVLCDFITSYGANGCKVRF